MQIRRVALPLFILILALGSAPLTAKGPTIAAGLQLGLAKTGVILDVGFGNLYLNAGLNYPVAYTYRKITDNVDPSEVLFKFAAFSLDVSAGFNTGENTKIKVGLGGFLLTNFNATTGGLIGPSIKGEYRFPKKDWTLFANATIPVVLFGEAIEQAGGNTNVGVKYHPLYPLLFILSSSVGVLYNF